MKSTGLNAGERALASVSALYADPSRRRDLLWVVAFASLASALAVLFLPWFQVRPNRLLEGTFESLELRSPGQAILIAAMWTAVAVLSLFSAFRRGSTGGMRAGTGLRSVALLIAVLSSLPVMALTGLSARAILGDDEIMRVSPAIGFWISIFCSYAVPVLLISSLRDVEADGTAGRQSPLRHSLYFIPLVFLLLLFSGVFDSLSVMKEYRNQEDVFQREALTHLLISGLSVAIGGLLGMLCGWIAAASRPFRGAIFFVLNLVQTLPSLALFGLMIFPLSALANRFPALRELGIGGIGIAPAMIALVLYALFPVARNSLTALENVPADSLDAARGLGMGRVAIFFRVKAPLALPPVAEALRTASVQSVGNTVIAALIGAGGLGTFIFQGLGQFAVDMILLGTIPVVLLAWAVDSLWKGAVVLLTPRTLRKST